MYERFLELLDEKGITSYRVSKETGVSQSVLSGWKNGRTPIHGNLKIIADYFHVSVDWLKGTSNEKKPASISADGLGGTDYEKLTAENRALVDLLIAKLLKGQSAE